MGEDNSGGGRRWPVLPSTVEIMPDARSTPATATGERIAEVDTLRGFALFGILITNVIVATTLWSFVGPDDDLRPHFDGTADHVVRAVVDALFSGRFYLLFAFLFGYSFTLQIAAAQRAGASANARLLRRCGALMAIGLVHVTLLWVGDILTLYAFLCLFLILLRKLRPRTAVITGAVLYLLWCGWGLLPGGNGDLSELGELLDLPSIHEGYAGSFGDTLDAQLSLAPGFLLIIWFTQGVTSLGLFLIGMAAGKRGLLADRETMRRWAPRVLVVGLGIGLPVSAVTFCHGADLFNAPSYWYGVQEMINPLMTFGYMAGIVLLIQSPRTAKFLGWLAPAGRMAATNYIAQSVVLMVVYTGYGFALLDTVPPAGQIAIGLLTFAAQVAVSNWWLQRYRYGPVEWVLRWATYLSVPAWRKERTPVAGSNPEHQPTQKH